VTSRSTASGGRAPALRYVPANAPGFRREKKGRTFVYRRDDGRLIRDPATLERIRRLAIPPAWTDVWICAAANGHLQATGRDARGRKQYRYHPDWSAGREANKFDRLREFGRALPAIRRQVAHDLRRAPLSRPAVLATVVRLLETTLIRVGNEEYARTNGSYGLTTLRDRHVDIGRERVRFHFCGKSGKLHHVELQDRQLAARLRRLQHLPGQELFVYKDETGRLHSINSDDVNDYLHAIAGDGFSAKDFRTWAGTLTAASLLSRLPIRNGRLTKRQVNEMIEQVAARQHAGYLPQKLHPSACDRKRSSRSRPRQRSLHACTTGSGYRAQPSGTRFASFPPFTPARGAICLRAGARWTGPGSAPWCAVAARVEYC
jgi:DNA topoisomerase-1